VFKYPREDRQFDAAIAEGERYLERYVVRLGEPILFLFAAAYHGRAVLAHAHRDFDAALRDVDRAVHFDPFAPYFTTRAIILAARGDLPAAREAIDAAFHTVELATRPPPARRDTAGARGQPPPRRSAEPLSDEEFARAHATRGTIALRQGDLDVAVSDLRAALALHMTAAHAHLLGAALYAAGDLAGAAEAEAQSVAIDATTPRYRWALIVSLHRLGNHAAARDHADVLLRAAPAYRARVDRLFAAR
jgi:tetratricopeptide (TPR) repeat protein